MKITKGENEERRNLEEDIFRKKKHTKKIQKLGHCFANFRTRFIIIMKINIPFIN